MLLIDRIKSFETLGLRLKNLSGETEKELFLASRNDNAWFVEQNVKLAIDGVGLFLSRKELDSWVAKYPIENIVPKKVGLITAGNIPLVGFHDILCVLLSGHHLVLKASSKDQVLTKYVLDQLIEIQPEFNTKVTWAERLTSADAFIATGSDNSARYFEHYFKNKPNLIRRNRTSVAVLKGNESTNDLQNFGKDIFQYFGLGCRNVSKVFVPSGYNFEGFLNELENYGSTLNHHKYRNNYDYNKSIYLVNGEKHLDTGFLLVKESNELVSPISVLYYQEYQNEDELEHLLKEDEEKIQCIIGKSDQFISFGQAQLPKLDDYADGVDTMKFLQAL